MRNAFLALPLLGLVSAASPEGSPAAVAPPGYKLVWSDEFNSGTVPDPGKWAYEIGHLRNHEAQYYTSRPENCRIEDGHLILEARREAFVPSPGAKAERITSASIETKGDARWTYGRIEARVKLPVARGTWPAVWMLGDPTDPAYKGWPARGEIDIMEHVGFAPDLIHGTVHTKAYNHVIHTAKGATTRIANPAEGFHLYAINWTPEQMDFYFDDAKYFTFKNEHKTPAEWPFDQPEHLKLNLAIGGEWGGQKGIDETAFPLRMEVDYVRVYQKVKD
jgi:beta-glucanase (GH16 family)